MSVILRELEEAGRRRELGRQRRASGARRGNLEVSGRGRGPTSVERRHGSACRGKGRALARARAARAHCAGSSPTAVPAPRSGADELQQQQRIATSRRVAHGPRTEGRSEGESALSLGQSCSPRAVHFACAGSPVRRLGQALERAHVRWRLALARGLRSSEEAGRSSKCRRPSWRVLRTARSASSCAIQAPQARRRRCDERSIDEPVKWGLQQVIGQRPCERVILSVRTPRGRSPTRVL